MEHNKIATDGGHWYTSDGKPFYEIENKSKPGEMRPVTLKDARSLNLYPSVTTIIKMASAQGLEVWKQKQILLAALTLPQKSGETADEFADRVISDSKHEAEIKRLKGQKIHGEIEKFFSGGLEDVEPEYRAYIDGVLDTIPSGQWSSEKSFANKFGFGGKIDLHDKDQTIVIDFKTKEFCKEDKLNLFDEHKMQLSAYAAGLEFVQPKMYICFVSTDTPGLCQLVEHTEYQRYLSMFMHLLQFYKYKNNYFPEEIK